MEFTIITVFLGISLIEQLNLGNNVTTGTKGKHVLTIFLGQNWNETPKRCLFILSAFTKCTKTRGNDTLHFLEDGIALSFPSALYKP